MRLVVTEPLSHYRLPLGTLCGPCSRKLLLELGSENLASPRQVRLGVQIRKVSHAKPCRASRLIQSPKDTVEVDEDLWAVLDICSNEELEDIHKILFGKSSIACRIQRSQIQQSQAQRVFYYCRWQLSKPACQVAGWRQRASCGGFERANCSHAQNRNKVSLPRGKQANLYVFVSS